MNRLLSVVIHDVAPVNWAACQRVMDAVREVGDVPMTLLAVPRFHLRPSEHAFERELSGLLSQGHELALHGYSHLDEGTPRGLRDHIKRRYYTDGEGEFSAITEYDALQRLSAGAAWFARRQWPLHGFVAPAWLMSQGAWHALRRLPISYTATLSAVYSLPHKTRIESSCLAFSTRSFWRRAACIPRNKWVASRWHDQPLVRIELHPHDADFPSIRKLWKDELARLLQHREALTMSAAMSRLGHQKDMHHAHAN